MRYIPVLLVLSVAVSACSSVPEKLWEGDASTPPIGEWSRTVSIPPGCGISHDETGCGEFFLIRYRYGDGAWQDHQPSVRAKASEVQFMLLKHGHPAPSYNLSCN